MLLQFSVENFLSFDAMTTFSMRATDEADHPSHVLQRGAHRVVRGAALYGANAAGKSNMVKAMAYARDLIISRKGTPLQESKPFRLGNNSDKPSGFHWQWIDAGQKWSYGFDIHGSQVVEEYLYAEPEENDEEQLWFERRMDEKGNTQIELGERILGNPSSDDAKLLELLAPRTPSSELLLHRCRDNEIQSIQPVLEWFDEVLIIVRAESDYKPLVMEAADNDELSNFLAEQIRDAGTGIVDIRSEKGSLEETILNLSEGHRELARKIFYGAASRLKKGEFVPLNSVSKWDSTIIIHKDDRGEALMKSLIPLHNSSTDELRPFQWEEESEGTQRYLHLLPRLYRLQTRPTVLIIDELERRLHTKLTRRFVEQSIGIVDLPESQLIFTTHDTNLLDNTLLRRDEIWFVDKNENGASSLYSMAQFKDFDSPDYEQAYLMGLFEAIPYFRNSHQLSPALRKTDENPES